MAISSANAAAAAKSRRVLTLTSGTSWTVPSGVEFVNVTLRGGGGGGGGGTSASGVGQNGLGGQIVSSTLTVTPGASIAYSIGAGGAFGNNVPNSGGAGGNTTFTGATTALGGAGGPKSGAAGEVGTNYLNAMNGGTGGQASAQGNTGGVGSIDIEYWV